MLIEQLLNAEVELNRLKAEEVPNVQLSPEEARGAMLLKMRQNNAEIAKAEEKIKQVEDEVKNYEEKIAEADNSLSELKGGRAEKFLEMQRKERKMQAFIDSFDTMKHEHEEAARLVHQRIVQLLRQTNQERTSMEDITKGHIHSENSQPSGSAIDIDDLLIVVEERQQELDQLKEDEDKNLKELATNRDKIASLEEEISKFEHLDELKTQWDDKCTVWFLNEWNFTTDLNVFHEHLFFTQLGFIK
uniref:Uncharacterized protein n=1 Tax=Physcomitrium patens TaxID=3218 RepID=A0A2K1KGG4_PHYPA|nr:hypothetical protein PHYPA_009255 [Physcomitrium patens]